MCIVPALKSGVEGLRLGVGFPFLLLALVLAEAHVPARTFFVGLLDFAGRSLDADIVLGLVQDHCRKHQGDFPPPISQLQERINAYRRNAEMTRVALPSPDGVSQQEFSRRMGILVDVVERRITPEEADIRLRDGR